MFRLSLFFISAGNEPKSCLHDLGDCRGGECNAVCCSEFHFRRNSGSVKCTAFLEMLLLKMIFTEYL